MKKQVGTVANLAKLANSMQHLLFLVLRTERLLGVLRNKFDVFFYIMFACFVCSCERPSLSSTKMLFMFSHFTSPPLSRMKGFEI